MPRAFAITAPTNSINLNNQGRGEVAFTVANTSGGKLRGRAVVKALDPTQSDWLSVVDESERDFDSQTVHQFTVEVAVPQGTPEGNYSFRLDVVSVENPDDVFDEGPVIAFQVHEAEVPAPKPLPWWILAFKRFLSWILAFKPFHWWIAAAAAGFVVVVVIVTVILSGNDMVLIPAGEFHMGSNDGDNDEKPVHPVYLDAFYMDKYEVTNAKYRKFMDANKDYKAPKYWNDPKYNAPDQPVVGVSWHDAAAFCEWLSKKEGKTYRLPTEAEWEKAARGGLVGKKYPWGDNESAHEYANYSGKDGRDKWDGVSSPVGSFPPNGYGLYDMAGNVWEWCQDWYDSNYYSTSPRENPIGPSSGELRVLRGGAWDTVVHGIRAADRVNGAPDSMNFVNGFRCVSQDSSVTP